MFVFFENDNLWMYRDNGSIDSIALAHKWRVYQVSMVIAAPLLSACPSIIHQYMYTGSVTHDLSRLYITL